MADARDMIMKSAGNALKNSDLFQGVSVTSDKTQRERLHLQTLRAQLKERIDCGEKDLTIRYLNGVPQIVKNQQKN